MTRIKQFADDLGISYNEAKKLIMSGRNKNDTGKSKLQKYLSEMEKSRKTVERLAQEDADMAMQKRAGGGASSLRDYTPAGGLVPDEEGRTVNIKGPIEMPEKIRKKRAEKKRKENLKSKGQDRTTSRASGGVSRRGDDQPVIMAKDGKYCRGMGRAYQGNPREVKIR